MLGVDCRWGERGRAGRVPEKQKPLCIISGGAGLKVCFAGHKSCSQIITIQNIIMTPLQPHRITFPSGLTCLSPQHFSINPPRHSRIIPFPRGGLSVLICWMAFFFQDERVVSLPIEITAVNDPPEIRLVPGGVLRLAEVSESCNPPGLTESAILSS